MPTRDKLPPCPDPERYTLTRTREGEYWRLKKKLKKPAVLNSMLQGNTELGKKSSSAGSRIYSALHPFLADLEPRRIFHKMITLLRNGFRHDGRLDVSVLRELDLQKDYPLRRLIRSGFQWQHDKENHVFRFRIQIPERNGALLRQSRQMSSYRFIIILVHGNPEQETTMQTSSIKSGEYPFAGTGTIDECQLELSYTPQPGQWLFCLRAECLEAGKVATHPRSRALLILDGGRWE